MDILVLVLDEGVYKSQLHWIRSTWQMVQNKIHFQKNFHTDNIFLNFLKSVSFLRGPAFDTISLFNYWENFCKQELSL